MALPQTIASAAYDAGIHTPLPLGQAVAIALAESGGNERAHNAVPPDDSYGAWQINMYGDLGPARRQQFGLSSNEDLYDLSVNAKAMMAISSGGTNWRPWSTFGGARYLLALPIANAAALAVIGIKGSKQTVETVTEPVTSVVDAAAESVASLKQAGAWLSNRNNWVRVLKVVAGVNLVAAGAFMLARPGQTFETVTRPLKGFL